MRGSGSVAGPSAESKAGIFVQKTKDFEIEKFLVKERKLKLKISQEIFRNSKYMKRI